MAKLKGFKIGRSDFKQMKTFPLLCMENSLGVNIFAFFLKSFQNIFAVQHKSNLFILVVQFHQHVLDLKKQKTKHNNNKERNEFVTRLFENDQTRTPSHHFQFISKVSLTLTPLLCNPLSETRINL